MAAARRNRRRPVIGRGRERLWLSGRLPRTRLAGPRRNRGRRVGGRRGGPGRRAADGRLRGGRHGGALIRGGRGAGPRGRARRLREPWCGLRRQPGAWGGGPAAAERGGRAVVLVALIAVAGERRLDRAVARRVVVPGAAAHEAVRRPVLRYRM